MESIERAKSVLTPQDHITRRAARNSRVHFDEDGYIPQLQEANPIQVQVTAEELSKTIGVYLGFLQEEHKYAVHFMIPIPMVEDYLLMSHSTCPKSASQEQKKIQGSEETSALDNLHIGANSSAAENGGDSKPTSTSTSSCLKIKSPSNLEVFGSGELCQVTEMKWGIEKAAGLQVHIDVIVPSTKDRHVLEDAFCIRSTSVPGRFVRINVGAKIMGKTMGTPTLKDGIKCIGVCRNPCDSSDSDSASDNENEVDMKDSPGRSSALS